jgi:hypothetical protein
MDDVAGDFIAFTGGTWGEKSRAFWEVKLAVTRGEDMQQGSWAEAH